MNRTVPVQWYVQDIFVSTVVVVGPDSLYVDTYLRRLTSTLRASYSNYEIVVIDNNVKPEELEDMKLLLSELPCIRIISLSREHDIDTAIFAGLEAAIGDYVCTLDQTLDPTEVIPDMVAANEEVDIIQGISTAPVKGVMGTRPGRKLFYWYNRKFMNIDISVNSTYLMAFNRKAINAITGSNRDHRHIRHLARVIGFKLGTFPYTPISNPRKVRSLRGGVIEALETITSYSTHPLRVVSWLGVIASFLNLIYAIYVVVINIVGKNLAQGWTTTSLQLSGMFFLLFLGIVIISEYINRILSEQRNDQKYLINDEFSSTVSIADTERKNVTK
ncbi:MAG: glycosyl transferase family 2 [Candidatus Saccharibacteria bacterium]|nr:glycosyl transferase family 2 [Candidatus Saccharibacteria bacterium]